MSSKVNTEDTIWVQKVSFDESIVYVNLITTPERYYKKYPTLKISFLYSDLGLSEDKNEVYSFENWREIGESFKLLK